MNSIELVNLQPLELKVLNGKPDLTVNIIPAKSIIFGGAIPGVPQDSALVTITVQNRLFFSPAPAKGLLAFGSAAKGVFLYIELSQGLHQVGNISVPPGFMTAVLPPNNQTIFCYNGTIQAGTSVDFIIEIIGDPNCGSHLMITAEVDPYNWIDEASEGNNKGRASIFVVSPC